MSVPMFLVDAYGIPRCPHCEGMVAPMRGGEAGAGLGVYCWSCGRNWFYEIVEGKTSNREERLPTSGTDTYTSSDFK